MQLLRMLTEAPTDELSNVGEEEIDKENQIKQSDDREPTEDSDEKTETETPPSLPAAQKKNIDACLKALTKFDKQYRKLQRTLQAHAAEQLDRRAS